METLTLKGLLGSIVIACALCVVAGGCDKAAAVQGPEGVPECADYIKVLDACDAKSKAPAKGVEQKVMRSTWTSTVASKPMSEVKKECKDNAAAKRKECGVP